MLLFQTIAIIIHSVNNSVELNRTRTNADWRSRFADREINYKCFERSVQWLFLLPKNKFINAV